MNDNILWDIESSNDIDFEIDIEIGEDINFDPLVKERIELLNSTQYV